MSIRQDVIINRSGHRYLFPRQCVRDELTRYLRLARADDVPWLFLGHVCSPTGWLEIYRRATILPQWDPDAPVPPVAHNIVTLRFCLLAIAGRRSVRPLPLFVGQDERDGLILWAVTHRRTSLKAAPPSSPHPNPA